MCPEYWYFYFSNLPYHTLTLNLKAKLPLYEALRSVASKEPRLPSNSAGATMALLGPSSSDQVSTRRKTPTLMISMARNSSEES